MVLTPRTTLIAGALLAGSGVVLGAFGAHALTARLSPAQLETWDTAVLYQFVHALALLVTGVLTHSASAFQMAPSAPARASAAFIAGVLLFSGSLYALALGAPRWLGPVTPIGGAALIVGWLLLIAGLLKAGSADD